MVCVSLVAKTTFELNVVAVITAVSNALRMSISPVNENIRHSDQAVVAVKKNNIYLRKRRWRACVICRLYRG